MIVFFVENHAIRVKTCWICDQEELTADIVVWQQISFPASADLRYDSWSRRTHCASRSTVKLVRQHCFYPHRVTKSIYCFLLQVRSRRRGKSGNGSSNTNRGPVTVITVELVYAVT